ncbi:MAG: hypothetical protein FWE68_01570, partial [Defluviitaleaceae bacterium]|nr:hypothetical protein [Defluviitaleaceae bacterium]
MNLIVPFCFSIIGWLMETIVAPLIALIAFALMPIFEALLPIVGDILLVVFADIFFELYLVLLKIVGFLSNAFFIFSGVYNIIENPGAGPLETRSFLLQFFLMQPDITRIYWAFTLVSAALCVFFTILKVMQSMAQWDYDPGKSVMKILNSCGKTLLIFLLIPSMMMAGINLSTIVIGQIAQHAFAYQGGLGIDTVIFLSSTMNAARDNNFNGEGAD